MPKESIIEKTCEQLHKHWIVEQHKKGVRGFPDKCSICGARLYVSTDKRRASCLNLNCNFSVVTHPCMVPYHLLSPEAKLQYKKQVYPTIRALREIGCSL